MRLVVLATLNTWIDTQHDRELVLFFFVLFSSSSSSDATSSPSLSPLQRGEVRGGKQVLLSSREPAVDLLTTQLAVATVLALVLAFARGASPGAALLVSRLLTPLTAALRLALLVLAALVRRLRLPLLHALLLLGLFFLVPALALLLAVPSALALPVTSARHNLEHKGHPQKCTC